MNIIKMGDKTIGSEQPTFVIAEAGSNHDGDLQQAKKLIDIAANAGADAVKFQTFTAEKIAADTDDDVVKLGDEYQGVPTLYQLYKGLELPRQWQAELKLYADEKGIIFLSTPFDYDAVDELETLGVEAYKVASFEMVDLPFLKYIAKKGKPVILSTGMADLGEIEEALEAIYSQGNDQVILLHCGISYPMPYDEVNLAAMDTMRQAFQVPVGYSDHTLSISVPLAAVARGACVIEKHFTLDRNLKGPDHRFAIEPDELSDMVTGIRQIESAIGRPIKKHTPSEEIHYRRGRRSIFAKVDIPNGTVITADMLAILRPGIGLKPKYIDIVIGRAAKMDIKKNDPITWDKI
ncbi:pseudaminic acid synthase [Mahella australiensis]|uniref:N-acetylneuraminate synthase n=1 Tax=Mahella australiensis (strain DSM 15567 / CIP 107919 / 50-1 BON) TaxID=697281 RepID=F3ZYZ4_MAHA5|nr:pseudaminic acid synthase [Mahella australiensis]AEE96753.1 N-acetylneuraminate synthase [Mahella australiensis 50-1 BON]